jgi:hypothetical protein
MSKRKKVLNGESYYSKSNIGIGIKEIASPLSFDDDVEEAQHDCSSDTLKLRKLQGSFEKLQNKLLSKKLSIKYIDLDFCDSLFASVSFGISLLPAPFNIVYPIKLLRHKTSQYMIGHKDKFVKKYIQKEIFDQYCHCIATTNASASSFPEALALANALQIKINIFYELRVAPDGFIIEEHGELYSESINIVYTIEDKVFLPVVNVA